MTKIMSIGPPSKEKRSFKKLKMLSLLASFISKIKTFRHFQFSISEIFHKGLLFLKIWHISVNICWNYVPLNLLFRFCCQRLGHLNNTNKNSRILGNAFFLKSYTKISVWGKFQVFWATHCKIKYFNLPTTKNVFEMERQPHFNG